MSTTIYDAYKAEIKTAKRLNALCAELRSIFLEGLLDDYVNMISSMLLELLEELPYLKAREPEKYKSRRASLLCMFRGGSAAGYPESENDEWKKKTELNAAIELAKMTADGRYRMMPELSQAELAVFDYDPVPGFKGDILIKAFGHRFTDLMAALPKDIARKYKISDWHYQNQTDKPDDISDFEWDARGKSWDAAMPSGIPSLDGTVIRLCNGMAFSMWLCPKESISEPEKKCEIYRLVEKKLTAGISADARLENRAVEIAKGRYAEERLKAADPEKRKKISTFMNISDEFMNKLGDKNKEIMAMVDAAREEMRPFMIDFSKPGNIEKIYGNIE